MEAAAIIPGLPPPSSAIPSMYKSSDIVQSTALDLSEMSRKLHSIEGSRPNRSRNHAVQDLWKAKLHRNGRDMSELHKQITMDVQMANRGKSMGSGSQVLMKIEDGVKFDTKRRKRALIALYGHIKRLDEEIRLVMSSDEGVVRFASRQHQMRFRLSSLESQIDMANMKVSTVQSQVRSLRVSLEDLNQSNQLLVSKLQASAERQIKYRTLITGEFNEINRITAEEPESLALLRNMITSSERLEAVCKQEWENIMVVVAEKNTIEGKVRRLHSGDEKVVSRRKASNLGEVVEQVYESTELDRVAKIWAQCTWSNAIDVVKIESGTAWLNQRRDSWNYLAMETGISADNDELCKWFTASEQTNIQQFNEVHALSEKSRELIDWMNGKEKKGDGAMGKRRWNEMRRLEQRLTTISHEMAELDIEREEYGAVLNQIYNELVAMVIGDGEGLDDSEIASNTRGISDMLSLVEEWTQHLLMNRYPAQRAMIPDTIEENTSLVQIRVPDMGKTAEWNSDDDDTA